MHLRSICFFNWCISQKRVGDSGQPTRVWCQVKHTKDSIANALRSAALDLRILRGRRLSSPSKLREYSIKNVLISIISTNSSGNLFISSVSYKYIKTPSLLFSWYFLSHLILLNVQTNMLLNTLYARLISKCTIYHPSYTSLKRSCFTRDHNSSLLYDDWIK